MFSVQLIFIYFPTGNLSVVVYFNMALSDVPSYEIELLEVEIGSRKEGMEKVKRN